MQEYTWPTTYRTEAKKLSQGSPLPTGSLPQPTVDRQPRGYHNLRAGIVWRSRDGPEACLTKLPLKHAVVLSAWDPSEAAKYTDPPRASAGQAPPGVEDCCDCRVGMVRGSPGVAWVTESRAAAAAEDPSWQGGEAARGGTT